MASVTGSRLAFYDGVGGKTVNVILTTDGSGVLPTVAGAYNLEVFTTAPALGTNLTTGFDGGAFIEGAVAVPGVTNEVQAATLGSTEQLLDGSYVVLDQFGDENIQVIGNGASATVPSSITVIGSAGDTIAGSAVAANSQLIDASNTNPSITKGAMTVGGGTGQTTVWAGSGDKITGGIGPITVAGDGSDNPNNINANNVAISGGAGNLTAFNLGHGDSVRGSTTATTFIDDGYVNGGGNTLVGGGGTTFIKGGAGDMIAGGAGITQIVAGSSNTIAGGNNSTTVTGNTNGRVTAGSGDLQYNAGSNSSLTGGAGNLFAFNLGTHNTIGGATNSGANTVIDDAYTNPTAPGSFTGGTNTLVGGAGATTIDAGPGDVINAGSGIMEAMFNSALTGNETVNLSAEVAGLRDVSVAGAAGTHVTVNNFSTALDTIQSATSVNASNMLQGTSSVVNGNTVITFLDGSMLTIVGVTSGIKFSQ